MARRPRSRAIAIASSGRNITRFQATIGKLQTTFRADAVARQISATDPSDRVRVNVLLLPGSRFSMVSPNSRVNCPTPHFICGPAPRNNAWYAGSEVIVRRQRLRVNVRVSHTFQTLASSKRRGRTRHRFCQIEYEKSLVVP